MSKKFVWIVMLFGFVYSLYVGMKPDSHVFAYDKTEKNGKKRAR